MLEGTGTEYSPHAIKFLSIWKIEGTMHSACLKRQKHEIFSKCPKKTCEKISLTYFSVRITQNFCLSQQIFHMSYELQYLFTV